MPNFDQLSEKDRAVLRSIFDPSLTIGEVAEEDAFMDDDDELAGSEAEKAAWEVSGRLEARAVRAAEAGEAGRRDALRLLHEAVAAAGSGAGEARARNNRAQLLRLMGRDDEAMADLDAALSPGVGCGAGCAGATRRVRAQALCQRGLLLRRRGATDAAKRDFAEAASLGSAFAKKQVAEMNPYAALCNQMLQQVMKGETDLKIGGPSQS